jgi:sulfatase modifying factor 1
VKALLALSALVLLACDAEVLPPTGQILVYFDTDAPVPPGPGVQPSSTDPPPLFDTLIVDVFPPGSTTPCVGCTRTFALDSSRLTALNASIGIPAPVGVSGYQIRVRMFPARWQVPCSTLPQCDGSTALVPHPGATVDVTFALPAVIQDTVTERTIVLRTSSAGQPQTISDGSDYFDGPPQTSLVGTWPPAARTMCSNTPRQDEVCIPGGAFWMGNPLLQGSSGGGANPHLVTLSPFFLKSAEVTVAEMRQLGVAADLGHDSSASLSIACTYTSAPGAFDDMPANCVSWGTANRFCNAWQGTLPTEAQLEYAESGLNGSFFVWGDDNPQCDDAVWGHPPPANDPTLSSTPTTICAGPLLTPPSLEDPSFPRNRDNLQSPAGGTVFDLNGSLDEFARDDFEGDGVGGSCWGAQGELHDPSCVSTNATTKVVHGTSFLEVARMAAWRTSFAPTEYGVLFGIRCARADP